MTVQAQSREAEHLDSDNGVGVRQSDGNFSVYMPERMSAEDAERILARLERQGNGGD